MIVTKIEAFKLFTNSSPTLQRVSISITIRYDKRVKSEEYLGIPTSTF